MRLDLGLALTSPAVRRGGGAPGPGAPAGYGFVTANSGADFVTTGSGAERIIVRTS